MDEKKFEMFAEHEQEFGFIVDSSKNATPIKNHPAFDNIRQASSDEVRIFTLSEAVDDVLKLINKS